MIQSRSVTVINRSLEEVFKYSIDHSRFSSWMPGVSATHDCSDVYINEGSTFRQRYLDGRNDAELFCRVIQFAPNQRWTYVGTNNLVWVRRSWRFKTTSLGTEVEFTEERMSRGLIDRLMSNFIENYYKKLNEEGCENLRKLVENQPAISLSKTAATSL